MKKVTFVLDNVRSAFNVGSVFRTADGLGYNIHLIGITPIPHKDPKLDKTSLSSLDYVKWDYFDKAETWFKYASIAGDKGSTNLIISIEETENFKSTSLFDLKNVDFEKYDNIYLVFGHEINGVQEFLLNKSDIVMKIPMFGKKNSLNVATCVGVVGYRVKELLS